MNCQEYLDKLKALLNEPFECASFSGGGAKGAIYSGVHRVLEGSGVLSGLKAVAGSSAGAITAAAIASGISGKDFKKISKETNFEELLGEGFIVNKDGKPLYQLIKNMISTNVANYLKETDVLELCDLRLQAIQDELDGLEEDSIPENTELRQELQKQQTKLQLIMDSGGKELAELNIRIQEEGKVYFKDLDLLHILDPVKFKDLVITATNRDTGELTIFDSRKTPDIEIALACRASASIPLVFEPVKINGVEYVDGGYRDNIPLNYFQNSQANKERDVEDISNSPEKVRRAKTQGRTLALAFGSDDLEDAANVAIYSAREKIWNPGAIAKFLMNVVYKALSKVGGKFKYTDEVNKTFKQLRENALNTVVLDTKEVSTLSFKEAQAKADYLYVKGYIQTSRHFENHFIGENRDKNLNNKEFMLEVYEQIQTNSTVGKWKDKIVGGKEEKVQKLFAFCKNKPWKSRDSRDVMKDFITVAATKRTNGKLSTDTTTMQKIVDILNDTKTLNAVKEDYITLLNIDIEKGNNYDKNKPRQTNIANFKFKTSDFSSLVSEKRSQMQQSTEKLKKSSSKRKPVDDIVRNGRKHKSMTEKVRKQSSEVLQSKVR